MVSMTLMTSRIAEVGAQFAALSTATVELAEEFRLMQEHINAKPVTQRATSSA